MKIFCCLDIHKINRSRLTGSWINLCIQNKTNKRTDLFLIRNFAMKVTNILFPYLKFAVFLSNSHSFIEPSVSCHKYRPDAVIL